MKLYVTKKKIGGLTYANPVCVNSKLIVALMGRGRKCFTQKQVKLMEKAGWEISEPPKESV